MDPPEPSAATAQAARDAAAQLGPLAPLKIAVFRMLWGTWLTANICMWMNDVAAAWLMTSLTTSPVWVALVQTAATMPVFLLGLPSGALADILDRRRYFIVTQFWMASVAVADVHRRSCSGAMTRAAAAGADVCQRHRAGDALAGVRRHRARAGAARATAGRAGAERHRDERLAHHRAADGRRADRQRGSDYVFVLNAALSVAPAFIIMRWKREHARQRAGPASACSAPCASACSMCGSRRGCARCCCASPLFFFHSTALLALLPLVARGMHGGGAAPSRCCWPAMGAGAIAAALLLPRLRQRWSRDRLVLRRHALQSLATRRVAFAPNVWVAVPAMLLAGMAWITIANSLSVSAQLALPDWVRARGMSIYQMAIMGGSALGAACGARWPT